MPTLYSAFATSAPHAPVNFPTAGWTQRVPAGGAVGVGGGTVGDVPAGAGVVDEPPLLAPLPPGDCAQAAPATAEQARNVTRNLHNMSSSGC